MIQYEGLCLGGPLDGERRVCQTSRLHTCERTEPRVSMYDAMCSGDISSAVATVRSVEYVHHSFKADGKDFGFWVLVDYLQHPRDVGSRDVMERLIENYRPVKKHYGRDVVEIGSKSFILKEI